MSVLRQLSKQDVLFVAGESSAIYQHTAGLVILDTSAQADFSFDYFRERLIERVSLVPHFRWKLHEVPLGLDLPYWVEDENFSYEHHIKRIAVPSPGDRKALAEVASHLYSKHLDRSRPLWEIWFIEGLADGKFAILQKLHHCMMDGQGASQLGQILCDFEPDAMPRPVDKTIADARPGAKPERLQMSLATALNLARFPGDLYRGIYNYARPRLLHRLRPGKGSKPAKPELPMAPFNAAISSERGFVFGSVPIADIKTVKNAFSVSVNDVVLALVGSALRNYLLGQGDLPELSLRSAIAVSLRNESDDKFSNRVTNTPVTLATDLEDPLARLRAINQETEQAKEQARSGAMGLLEMMNILPPLLISAMVSTVQAEQAPGMLGANLIVSSVRGSTEPMYIAGARMETMYPMSIITHGMGLNITCVSYADNVDFGVAIAPDLLRRPWGLIDGIGEALAEYLLLAKKSAAVSGVKPRAKKKRPAAKKAPVKRKASAKAPRKRANGTAIAP
jgi:diacylglycerol O-acyltransferase